MSLDQAKRPMNNNSHTTNQAYSGYPLFSLIQILDHHSLNYSCDLNIHLSLLETA